MWDAMFGPLRRWRMHVVKPFGPCPAELLRIHFADANLQVTESLGKAFHDVPGSEILQGNLLDLRCDAIVSPANSFGDMGGGIDKAIDDFFKGEAQPKIMAAIAEHYLGELPVGVALIVPMSSSRFPFLIAAPTMRIPGHVSGSINAYLAMRGILVSVLLYNSSRHPPIRSVAMSGLATGVGGIPPDDAAAQMRAAYDNVISSEWRLVVSPVQAPFALREHRT